MSYLKVVCLLQKLKRPPKIKNSEAFVFIISFLFLSSCSSIPNSEKSHKLSNKRKIDQKLELLTLEKSLEAICLSGEGKGRISLREKSQSFSFESLFDPAGIWSMGVSIPFHGEEIFRLIWKDVIQGRVEAVGPFVPSIKELKKRNLNEETFQELTHQMAFLLYFISNRKEFLCEIDEKLSEYSVNTYGICKWKQDNRKFLRWIVVNSGEEVLLVQSVDSNSSFLFKASEKQKRGENFEIDAFEKLQSFLFEEKLLSSDHSQKQKEQKKQDEQEDLLSRLDKTKKKAELTLSLSQCTTL